jgi:hypothetical protein
LDTMNDFKPISQSALNFPKCTKEVVVFRLTQFNTYLDFNY